MSKAEKFIEDCTRNCSNEIIVPTQDGNSYTKGYTHWLTPDQARKAVEIAREEIIEKLCEFLDNDLCCYIKAQDYAIEHQRLENDLKMHLQRIKIQTEKMLLTAADDGG